MALYAVNLGQYDEDALVLATYNLATGEQADEFIPIPPELAGDWHSVIGAYPVRDGFWIVVRTPRPPPSQFVYEYKVVRLYTTGNRFEAVDGYFELFWNAPTVVQARNGKHVIIGFPDQDYFYLSSDGGKTFSVRPSPTRDPAPEYGGFNLYPRAYMFCGDGENPTIRALWGGDGAFVHRYSLNMGSTWVTLHGNIWEPETPAGAYFSCVTGGEDMPLWSIMDSYSTTYGETGSLLCKAQLDPPACGIALPNIGNFSFLIDNLADEIAPDGEWVDWWSGYVINRDGTFSIASPDLQYYLAIIDIGEPERSEFWTGFRLTHEIP